MASFTHGFGAALPYKGSGNSFTHSFFAHYPPEAGCLGLSAAGGDLTIEARATTRFRELLARAVTDGTGFKITKFAVGVGGYNVSYPIQALPVDPGQSALISEVFRKEISAVETPLLSGIAKAFVCRLGRDELKAGIGEVGLVAEIVHSDYPSEIGTEFMCAIVHQPLNAKTHHHVTTYRVVIVL